jgi:hypothetical protein
VVSLRVALSIAGAGIGACSIVYSSDLNGARDVTELADGGRIPPDGAVSTNDGGADARDAGADASPAVGCAALGASWGFCDDFDAKTTIASWWTVNLDPLPPSPLDTLAFSPPHSFKAVLSNAPSCTYARVEQVFHSLGTHQQEVAMKVRLSAFNGDVRILALGYDSGGAVDRCTAIFGLEGDGARITEAYVDFQQETPRDDDRPMDIPVGDEWTDIDVTTTAVAQGVSADVVVTRGDGSAHKTTYAVPQCKLGPNLFAMVGFHCSSGTAEVRYDDVRMRSN